MRLQERVIMSTTLFRIQTEAIDKTHVLELEDLSNEGARLVFIGLVRDYSKSHSGVVSIDYHCYREMAEQEGLQILKQAIDKFEITRIACIHRIGMLALQDIAIKLEIASEHRLAALHACIYIMDKIKLLVPIWKQEYYNNGNKREWL